MMATTAKYVRLSSEDDDLRKGGKLESNSIANQRDLLDAFISRMPELAGTNIIEFCDDGWSSQTEIQNQSSSLMLLLLRYFATTLSKIIYLVTKEKLDKQSLVTRVSFLLCHLVNDV